MRDLTIETLNRVVPFLPDACIYLITDRRRLSPEARSVREELSALEALCADAVAAGVDVIQVRERDLEAGTLAGLVRRVTERATGSTTRVLVNDRADVAWASGADGVHLRSDGIQASRVRSVNSQWVIGRSVHVHDPPSVLEGADYAVFGSIYETVSKTGGGRPAGVAALAAAVARSPVPVVAIGGIDPGRAEACGRAGAVGVAGIGVFLPEACGAGALGVQRAVPLLRESLRRGQATRHPPHSVEIRPSGTMPPDA